MGFHIDEDPHHLWCAFAIQLLSGRNSFMWFVAVVSGDSQFFADHVGPCEIHSCSRSIKTKRRGLYLSIEFKYEEDAQRMMAM